VLKLDAELLRDLPRASSREWLLADGLGGYASSTPIGLNTRRYHGLLVVATNPPVGRMVLLSRLEETLIVGDERIELGTNAYPGAIHPRGFERAVGFVLDPLPSLTWETPGGRLTRTVARVHGHPGAVILYSYEEDAKPATLELRPLVAYRDYHALQRENDALRREVEGAADDVVLRPYDGCPPLQLRVPGATWSNDGCWYRQFQYERERERGLEASEDLFSHGVFSVPLGPGRSVPLVAWAGAIPPATDAVALVAAERRRLREQAGGYDDISGSLRRAADAFVVRRGESGRTLIAGYPWFADWGRDTMIALPGLCLSTGRFDDARSILGEFARHVDAGMIPNRFPDDGEAPEYNTVDAALWMVVAVERYFEATKDHEFVREVMLPAVRAILDGYTNGTRHGIRMTPDGLITQGGPGLQLTWMDAKLGDWVVTPRSGQPVEIQALWYNALLIGAELAGAFGDAERASQWTALASRCRTSFLRTFWSEDLGYLADVVSGGTRDLSLRPNQLYAIGLPHAVVPRDKAARVLSAVKRELVTPVGLRTLAPSDPAYRPRYQGDPRSRDGAYHQGTVWPFLMGVYFDALVRVHGEEGNQEAREWLRGFAPHLTKAGLGFVSELFDADAPHRPGGAIAQAWSVAELLRIASRLPQKPPQLANRGI
jgi:predicted glycogen debranching enzyme